MTDMQLNAKLLARRARLAKEASTQALELRARQLSGQQHVGPWAPAARAPNPSMVESLTEHCHHVADAKPRPYLAQRHHACLRLMPVHRGRHDYGR